jgi:hypothetical protein
MKRDLSVWLALLMVAVPWVIGANMGMPQQIDEDDPWIFHFFFWSMLLGGLRITVFWFQTLIHGVKYAKEENRVAVVLGHIFLGPVMAYGYYLVSRNDAHQHRSNGEESG